MTVSIILPAYNEQEMIVEALNEIDRQRFRDREMIVVDDGSTDRTFEIASAWIGTRTDARAIKTPHLGPSHARNEGVKLAGGKVLFFAESDCVYEPEYLEKAVERLVSDPGSSAVCLTGAPLKTRSTLATECIEIENKVQHRLLNEGKMKPFYAWVFLRSAFLSTGGFDERLFQGEDKDLFRRFEGIGFRVAWIQGVHWWHKRDQTTWSLARKWFTRGRSRVVYTLKHRLVLDFAKSILPVTTMIVGLVTLVFYPFVGGILILAVLAAILAQSLRIARISWGHSENHWAYIGYPVFVLVRNFATGIGYFVGLALMAIGRNVSAS